MKDQITKYLADIDRFPLLTPEQEKEYSHQIQRMINLAGYPSQGLKTDNLTESEKRIVDQGIRAYKRFSESNLRLVVSVVKRFRNRGLDFATLIQAGNIGLLKAVEKFDGTKGYRFSTYGFHWIRQSCQRAISNHSRLIRLPLNISDNLDKINRVTNQFYSKFKRYPTIKELAVETKLSEETVRYCLDNDRIIISLNKVFQDDDHSLEDIISENLDDSDKELIELVREILEDLPEDIRLALKLYYGFETKPNGRNYNLNEIAARLNINSSDVECLLYLGKNIISDALR